MMRSCGMRGRELLDANVLTDADLHEWLKGKNGNEASIVGVGLPCYSFMQTILSSIKSNSSGFVLIDGLEITHLNRPKDKLLDWFFNPIMVLKEQISVIKLEDGEVGCLERVALFGSNTQRLEAWDNGSIVLQDPLRAAEIQGISRRMIGMIKSVSKFPTYRRRFQQIEKALLVHYVDHDISLLSGGFIVSNASDESV